MAETLNVVVDQRFRRTPDGRVWTFTPPSYGSFESVLGVFEQIRVIARTVDVPEPPVQARTVTGPRVEVYGVPSYVGPLAYLRRHRDITHSLERAAELDGAFLFRIPSQMAFVMAPLVQKSGRRFAAELLTDPHDFFAPGVAPHGLAFLFRHYFVRRSRELCGQAAVMNYVTGEATRRANPALAAHWAESLSDVELPREAFLALTERRARGRLRVVSVGFLDLLYKGQDVLIRALASSGVDFELTFVGDGQHRTQLLELAQSLGVGSRVRVTGALGGPEQVRSYLAEADVFSLPSRAEGIPRALLEAMAAGLPAICSRVGAMADLLEPRWIVEPNCPAALSSKFAEFYRAETEWTGIGRRNQEAVRGYEAGVLGPKRLEFYRAIRHYCLPMAAASEVRHAA